MKKIGQDGGNRLFVRFVGIEIVCWFFINIANFINMSFFKVLIGSSNIYFNEKIIFIIATILALFFTFYADTIDKLLFIKKGTHFYSIKDSYIKLKKRLSLFEKSMYLFFMLIVFLIGNIFIEIFSIYSIRIAGIWVGVLGYIAMLYMLFYFLYLLFISQKFLFYKMGLPNA